MSRRKSDPTETAFAAWLALDELQRAKFDGMVIATARAGGVQPAPATRKPRNKAASGGAEVEASTMT